MITDLLFLYMVLCIPFVWAFVRAFMSACVRGV